MTARLLVCVLVVMSHVACVATNNEGGPGPDPQPTTVIDDAFDSWDSSAWRGGRWCGNSYDGDLSPVAGDGVLALAEGDFCWAQILSRATVSNAGITVIPYLESGGANSDALFVALAEDWVQYGSGSVAGLRFANGTITAFSDGADAGSLGSYVSGQPVQISFASTGVTDLSIQVSGQQLTIATSFAFDAEPNIVIAVKDSDDGADVDRVSGKSLEAAQ